MNVGYLKLGDALVNIDSVNVLHLNPGDKLAVHLNAELRQEEADRVRAIIEHWAGVPVLVFPSGVTLEVVHA